MNIKILLIININFIVLCRKTHKNDIISEMECSIKLKNSKIFYDKISNNHKIDIKYLKTK